MKINCKVPLPVTFNCWKHHAGFIKHQINTSRTGETSEEELRKILLLIGESQMDLYLGKLSPAGIVNDLIIRLKEMAAFNFKEYIEWLHRERKEYKLLKISDNSLWTLRLGQQKERFIHIHPGRYSSNTIRIKALTLKTVITVLIMKHNKNVSLIDTSFINEVRVRILNSPPIKKVTSDSAVARAINLLS